MEPMNRMANLVEPFLNADERSMLSFTAKQGPSPWLPIGAGALAAAAGYRGASLLPFDFPGLHLWVALAVGMAVVTALNLVCYRHRIVVVSNRSILLLQADTLNGTPTKVLSRVDRKTQLGPARGIHSRTEIDGERLWVPIRWRALLDVSDRGREQQRQGSAADRREPSTTGEAEIDLRPSTREQASTDDAKASKSFD